LGALKAPFSRVPRGVEAKKKLLKLQLLALKIGGQTKNILFGLSWSFQA
jgi:hypothetical protein